ncbi:MAG: prolipoprotein diacylglyceryl transferase [Bdellovibrionales bacterium GWB1_52_6]|nr:MAG: prolipoprotein diacylglyceryl transferase [Bdellovibrionales bacterium GWB1_52_6]OFZ04315.1 MAG: prolipoprotein diacylglyceryl transferase [Bdellovibrionales bacterium GWA1_52_35]HCM40834.1 prolipoprotein diacylglyceryl transferase [Bdellovibrionales bacterium]
MHPLLANVGPIPIHTYGFLIAIGFLLGMYTIKRLAIAAKMDAERILDFSFWSILVGFLGARLLFILTRFGDFSADPLAMFKVWEGGLVFFGGPMAVLPFSIWYFKKHSIPWWKGADVTMPGLVIAHVLGRFGCLAAGCCYGKPTGTDFGVRLTSSLVDFNLRGIPLHPTQLYEASALFILFLGLLWVFKRRSFDGQVALTYYVAYPIIRSIVEIFRGDLVRGFVIEDWLSTSQFISLIAFIAAATALVLRLKAVPAAPLLAEQGPRRRNGKRGRV